MTQTNTTNTATDIKIESSDKSLADLINKRFEAVIQPQLGQAVTGTVMAITKRRILVDIADGIYTGIISGNEVNDSMDTAGSLEIGGDVTAVVVEPENSDGNLVLSIRKASQAHVWDRFNEAMANDDALSVRVTDANKGGLLIDVDGIKGFIPVSQLAPHNYPRVSNGNSDEILGRLKSLINRELEVKILNIDERTGKLVFSEKKAFIGQNSETLKKLEPGTIIEGIVTGIVDFGIFVGFEGLEGLVHISEITWGKVTSPGDYVKEGEKVNVMVLSADENKISLSIKRLTKDPWVSAAEKYHVNDILEGTISQIVDYGAFIKLDDEVSGLLHSSEIGTEVTVGNAVKVRIISMDLSEHRLGLSMKLDESTDSNE